MFSLFVFFKKKTHLPLIVSYMNSKHRSAKFTFKFDNSKSFSFLDL